LIEKKQRILAEAILLWVVLAAIQFVARGYLVRYPALFVLLWILPPTLVIWLRSEGDFDTYGLTLERPGRGFLEILILAGIVLPLYAIGFYFFWTRVLKASYVFQWRSGVLPGAVLYHLFFVAIPEEYFFRGYLQTRLEPIFQRRIEVFGAKLGGEVLVSAALFALTHLLEAPHGARLLTFFPALLFGYLRKKTGSLLFPILFHLACNMVEAILYWGLS
jgi:membrane protease YdiL (CAAX protease family)